MTAPARTNFDKAKVWALRGALLGALLAAVVAGWKGYSEVSGAILGRSTREFEHTRLQLAAELAGRNVRTAASNLQTARAKRALLERPFEEAQQLARLRGLPLLQYDPAAVAYRSATEAERLAWSELTRTEHEEASARSALGAHHVDPNWNRVAEQIFALGAIAFGLGAALPAVVAAWFLFLHMIGQVSAAARGQDKNS